MEYLIFNINKNIHLSDNIFNYHFNHKLIQQLINSYIVSNKKGTKSQKSRSEVMGSNKKPWKQKGTGKARAGTVKSPLWRKGGVTFAANPIIKSLKINKKMYKIGIKSIFSQLIRKKKIILITKFIVNKPKTSLFIKNLNLINNIFSSPRICLIDLILEQNLILSSRNLRNKINVFSIKNIKLMKLLHSNFIIITLSAIKYLENFLL